MCHHISHTAMKFYYESDLHFNTTNVLDLSLATVMSIVFIFHYNKCVTKYLQQYRIILSLIVLLLKFQ